jgi:plasmid stability protein
MTGQTVVLQVPDGLYVRLKRRAEQAGRGVEAEVLDVLAAAVPDGEDLAPDLQQAIASLELLDDEALRRAAEGRLAGALTAELEGLHLKQQREGLTPAETERCNELIGHYERAMLVRAKAAALLHQRGYDVSPLVTRP